LSLMAEALAELDGLTALADLAQTRSYVEPTLDASPVFEVEDGRHPVVEAMLREQGEAFVANDCKLDASGEAERLLLVTGPNMAGKSTFLRQNALLVILAQIGSFVPARLARIGVVDRLFSRVGAADDLARGRSTFLVEMVETAAILNQSTAQSFVILDEIGRGTATYDGLSIAWAAIEHLHDANACRALFATHYHELTALAEHLDGLANVSMRVREWEGQVVFMHEVIAGAADRSYGIHVADLAGLPKPVIARARALMRQLEKGGRTITVVRGPEDLPLFVSASQAPPDATPAAQAAPAPAPPSPVEERLAAIDPDTLTPRVALDLVYDLKKLLTIGETSS
ncbi:MAG: DNA mismatch repair protein MutS, partial [Pseudomonadota bacterium]